MRVKTMAEWIDAGVENCLSVVIPAYNEEAHIAGTVRSLASALEQAGIAHEILVVNDNSSDRTEEVLQGLEQELPCLRHVNNTPPNGFGHAVRCGLTEFQGDVVALVMADGSDYPEDVVAFYRTIQQGYECVFGSRFISGGEVRDYPWLKYVLNRLGNTMLRMLFWCSYNDFSNAFKMYRREVIAGVQPLMASQFNLTVELSLKAVVRGYTFAVVPNRWRNRKGGVSKFRIKEMGSRYFFIVLYCFLEKMLSRQDYHRSKQTFDEQLQVWPK